MRILIEFANGTQDAIAKAESILRNRRIFFSRCAYAFDAPDADLMRFVHAEVPGDVNSENVSKAISALGSASEVISAVPEPNVEVP